MTGNARIDTVSLQAKLQRAAEVDTVPAAPKYFQLLTY